VMWWLEVLQRESRTSTSQVTGVRGVLVGEKKWEKECCSYQRKTVGGGGEAGGKSTTTQNRASPQRGRIKQRGAYDLKSAGNVKQKRVKNDGGGKERSTKKHRILSKKKTWGKTSGKIDPRK